MHCTFAVHVKSDRLAGQSHKDKGVTLALNRRLNLIPYSAVQFFRITLTNMQFANGKPLSQQLNLTVANDL